MAFKAQNTRSPKPGVNLRTAWKTRRICGEMPWAAACRASRTGAVARGIGSRRVPRDAPRTGLAGSCWWSSEWMWMCWMCSDYWRCSLHSRLQDSQAPGGACEESRGTCARRARWSRGRCARSRLLDEFGTRASSRPSFSWMGVCKQLVIISITFLTL